MDELQKAKLRLQSDVAGLQKTLSQRDDYIRALSDELTTLKNEKLSLTQQLEQAKEAAPPESPATSAAKRILAQPTQIETADPPLKEFATVNRERLAFQLENTDLRERLVKEAADLNKAKQELSVIKQRVDLSFTASELSGYITRAIDAFNGETNVEGSSVNYIINEMEIDFKASLSKNDTGEMTLSAPSLSGGGDTLSSVKFSIRAIPKGENPI
jgi:DNA repair exonuclease SbcCD ATPase subunit